MMQKNTDKLQPKEVIDDARSHFLNNFPDEIPIENAFTHIGMYLGWVIDNELYSEDFEDEFAVQMIRFKNRVTSCMIVGELWDGLVYSEQFSEDEGLLFTEFYYKSGQYLKDYASTLSEGLDSIFHVEDSWENYNKMSTLLTSRFQEWKNNR